jgi:hypothetical protein
VSASKYLGIYLNDHLAGATGIVELLRRARSRDPESELGQFLTGLEVEILEDRRVLLRIMAALGVRPDPVKRAAAWAAEKAGRLKLNGHLLSPSPLSPLIELEALSLGIEGKLLLWLALAELPGDEPLAPGTLAGLIERAEGQRSSVERYRVAAARTAAAAA